MIGKDRIFRNEAQIGIGLSEILHGHEGFLIGGYAIGLHLGNLNYRHHDDIDMMCPLSHHESLYKAVAAAAVNSPIEDDFYYPGNQTVVLEVAPRPILARRSLVELHMTAYTEDEEKYVFPFNLVIPKPFQLYGTIEYSGKSLHVATVDLLLAMKRHAIQYPLMYDSVKQKYKLDIAILENLQKQNRSSS
jgi:hypothetical protein